MSKSTIRKVIFIYMLWFCAGVLLLVAQGVFQTVLGNSLFVGIILPLVCFLLGVINYYELIMPETRPIYR